MVIAEAKHDNSSINSFGDYCWYFFVTISSVGYGDMYPVTLFGKIIGAIVILQGLAFIGIVVGNITQNLKVKQEKRLMGFNGTNFENHIVIIGWNGFAKELIGNLIFAKKIALVCDNKEILDYIYEEFSPERLFVLITPYTNYDMMEKAGLSKAEVVYINLPNDTDKLIALLHLKYLYSEKKDKRSNLKLKFMVTLEDLQLKSSFLQAGVRYIIPKDNIASQLTASYIFEPDVAEFNTDILSKAKYETDYDVQQFKVITGNPFIGKSYGDMFHEIKTKYNSIAVGISKREEGNRKLIKLPADNIIINENDYILFINNSETEKIITGVFKISQGA